MAKVFIRPRKVTLIVLVAVGTTTCLVAACVKGIVENKRTIAGKIVNQVTNKNDGRIDQFIVVPVPHSDDEGWLAKNSASDPVHNFVLRGFAPGRYALYALFDISGERYSSHTEVDVGDSDVRNLTVRVNRGPQLQGKLTMDGADAFIPTNISVSIQPRAHPLLILGTKTVNVRSDGSFQFANLAETEYRLLPFRGLPPNSYVASAIVDGTDALLESFPIEGPIVRNLKIVVRPCGGTITGHVSEREMGSREDVAVVILPRSGGYGPAMMRSAITKTGGSFRVGGMSPGQYRVLALPSRGQKTFRSDRKYLREFDSEGVFVDLKECSDMKVEIPVAVH
jgi:hypothetical protein